MHLHILTLNWNGEQKLKNLQPRLFNNCNFLVSNGLIDDFTWHVKDNGSSDGSFEFLKDLKNSIVYKIGHNRDNFSKGVNFLSKESGFNANDYLLLLNNDVVFNNSESLFDMVQLQLKTNSDIVGAKLNYLNSNIIQSCGTAFSNKYNKMPWHIFAGEKESSHHKQNRYFQAVTAAVLLCTGRSFKEVYGLDENYFWAFEDVDFCLKVNQIKPNNIAYCGTTNIFHEESASLKKNPVNKMFLQQNVVYFKKKWENKYDLDFEKYELNKNYRLIK